MVAGVAAHTLLPGGQGLAHAAIGGAVGLAVFFPFFALGGMGGGDVKLMAALGTWIGWSPIVWTALYGAVAGGVMALVVGLSHGYLRQAISNVGGLLVFWSTQGIRPMAALTLEHGQRSAAALCTADLRGTGGDAMATLTRKPRWHSERGAELIEMVVVLPLLLLVMFGIIDFGFMFQRYVVLTNAAMEGARVGILPGYTTATPKTRAETYAATGGIPGRRRLSPRRYLPRAGRRHLAGRAGGRHSHLHLRVHRPDHHRSSAAPSGR